MACSLADIPDVDSALPADGDVRVAWILLAAALAFGVSLLAYAYQVRDKRTAILPQERTTPLLA
tara:strand:- start:640 stop:831 length:192 start_codon:yes stop_codon:yes gene_type:complete